MLIGESRQRKEMADRDLTKGRKYDGQCREVVEACSISARKASSFWYTWKAVASRLTNEKVQSATVRGILFYTASLLQVFFALRSEEGE